ncbi:MAG: hypothetical protein GQF41_0449 [Candidatus Rifleibacterium amylolyticum]|nr:MAG: hypothetical protein GQF41_0449 [Candidatus Rifleibacterium amylolyticum]
MLISINDVCFIFEILNPDESLPDFVRAAKASKISRIDMGRNMAVKFLEDLKKVDQSGLRNKAHKRLAILLEELEEAVAEMPVGEKHPAMKAFEEELQGKNFSSHAELQEFIASRNADINERPQPDLGNLSASQLQRLFTQGWWQTGGPVKLSSDFSEAEAEAAPFINNMRLVLKSILARSGPKGLKATPTGNLPRSVVSDIAPGLMDPAGYDICEINSGKKVLNEIDLYSLYIQRNIALVANLVKLTNNHWQVTPRGQNFLQPGTAAELLVTLFATTFKSIALDNMDSYPPDDGFHYTIPYSLWRIANLSEGAEYAASELAGIVVHPETLRRGTQPAFKGAPYTLAERIAESRLFRPLSWFNCLEQVKNEKSFEDNYRVTGLAAKIYRTPNFPKP